jgi:hypothetical protein
MTQKFFLAAHPLVTFLTFAAVMSVPASASKVNPCTSTLQASAVERPPARYGWCRCRSGVSYGTSSTYSTRSRAASTYRAAYNPKRPSVQQSYVAREERGHVVRHRSKKKSLAIIAGSAALGAAIGGIAGGGEGAGIGALTGGAAGFIYDRLTHRHQLRRNRARETATRTSRTIPRG